MGNLIAKRRVAGLRVLKFSNSTTKMVEAALTAHVFMLELYGRGFAATIIRPASKSYALIATYQGTAESTGYYPMPNNTDWAAIEKYMLLGNSFADAEQTFGVKHDTIRKRATRYRWPLPSVIAKLAAVQQSKASENGVIAVQAAKTLAERGEEHAKTVFDLASGALKALKKLPVRNWKDAEIADKAARRSAGMGNDDEGARISIIQLNEALESHKTDDEVIEGELVTNLPETVNTTSAPETLPR